MNFGPFVGFENLEIRDNFLRQITETFYTNLMKIRNINSRQSKALT